MKRHEKGIYATHGKPTLFGEVALVDNHPVLAFVKHEEMYSYITLPEMITLIKKLCPEVTLADMIAMITDCYTAD